MTNRQRKILQKVIEHYQNTGEPISSRWLVEQGDLKVSPATVRSELHELESLGMLEHLHTSGGRLPTEAGYRFYINSCLEVQGLADPLLASFVKNACVQFGSDAFELSRALGLFLSRRLAMPVISSIDDGLDCWKGGFSFLSRYEEMWGKERILPILAFIDQFEYLFAGIIDHRMLERGSAPVQVFIGEDNQQFGLKDIALIVCRFPLPARSHGRLLIIGPMRMHYQNTLPYISNLVHEIEKLYSDKNISN